MWLYVLGRKTSSDVDICLFGTVVHNADVDQWVSGNPLDR